MSARYFRSSPDAYSDICAWLDAAYGYPNPQTRTWRALPPVDDLGADEQGRVYLEVLAEFCDYDLPKQILSQMIAAGLVDELTLAEWQQIFPPAQVPSP